MKWREKDKKILLYNYNWNVIINNEKFSFHKLVKLLKDKSLIYSSMKIYKENWLNILKLNININYIQFQDVWSIFSIYFHKKINQTFISSIILLIYKIKIFHYL